MGGSRTTCYNYWEEHSEIRLEQHRKAKGQWVEELPNVLWAHHTTAKTRNHCTPFSLVYGSEAVLPPEIGVPTYRIQSYEENMQTFDSI
ncbi:reverse transcriptase domain-containing protein [Tanacetum coccineum]